LRDDSLCGSAGGGGYMCVLVAGGGAESDGGVCAMGGIVGCFLLRVWCLVICGGGGCSTWRAFWCFGFAGFGRDAGDAGGGKGREWRSN